MTAEDAIAYVHIRAAAARKDAKQFERDTLARLILTERARVLEQMAGELGALAAANAKPEEAPTDVRRQALFDAANDVCMYCSGHAIGYGPPVGPNAAGNFVHYPGGSSDDVLCAASSIVSRLAFEYRTAVANKSTPPRSGTRPEDGRSNPSGPGPAGLATGDANAPGGVVQAKCPHGMHESECPCSTPVPGLEPVKPEPREPEIIDLMDVFKKHFAEVKAKAICVDGTPCDTMDCCGKRAEKEGEEDR